MKLPEAYERLTVSRRTIDRLIAKGELAVPRVSEKRFAVDEDELDRYIQVQTTRATLPRVTTGVSFPIIYDDSAEQRLLLRFSQRGRKRE